MKMAGGGKRVLSLLLRRFAGNTARREEDYRHVSADSICSARWRSDFSRHRAAPYNARRPPVMALDLGPNNLSWPERSLGVVMRSRLGFGFLGKLLREDMSISIVVCCTCESATGPF